MRRSWKPRSRSWHRPPTVSRWTSSACSSPRWMPQSRVSVPDVSEFIKATLNGDAGVTSLVKNRIHAGELPQQPTMPAVNFWLVDGAAEMRGSGVDWADRDTWRTSSWANSITQALAVAREVRRVLRRAVGECAGINVHHSQLVMKTGAYEDGPQRYRVDQDFEFVYSMAA